MEKKKKRQNSKYYRIVRKLQNKDSENISPCSKPFTTYSTLLMTLRKKPFENIVGKGGNAGNQHFLPFPQHFLLFQDQYKISESHLFCCLQSL